MYWAAFAIITALCLVGSNQSDNANYGPYRIIWRKYEMCKGPKQGNCGNVKIRSNQNMSDVIFYLDLPNDCPLTKGRITAALVQKNNYTKKILNYDVEKPCQHFVLGPILVEAFNLSSACIIKKGQYTVHVNVHDKCELFLGSNFFYGIYAFKTMAFNNVKNVFCLKSDLETRKL